MQTLLTEGLPLPPADGSFSELLQWLAVPANLPDTDTTVIVRVSDADDHIEWWSGWWDSADEIWREASTGGEFAGTVTHYAEPLKGQL